LLNSNTDSSWYKTSASLDTSVKIYALRVDSVHYDTFKFLSGLTRNDFKNEEDINDNKQEKREKIGNVLLL
jgi:hypothetical protein